jgi:plasmid stabilization system protein ParE
VFVVESAHSARRDIRGIIAELLTLAEKGKVPGDFPQRVFSEVEDALEGLQQMPERHPYAPEREAWRRDVRNVLLDSGYRVLFQVHEKTVWVMRIRHQRQRQLEAAGPGSAHRPDRIVL